MYFVTYLLTTETLLTFADLNLALHEEDHHRLCRSDTMRTYTTVHLENYFTFNKKNSKILFVSFCCSKTKGRMILVLRLV